MFNIILLSKIQPTAWNANKTILVPKQGKYSSRAENYTHDDRLTPMPHILGQNKLRNVIILSPRQKDFVHETGYFNNIHILNKTIKAGKTSRDRNGHKQGLRHSSAQGRRRSYGTPRTP